MKTCSDIAVITPVYNESLRAIKTIKCILRNFKGLIIVVDDGSTDDTDKLLKESFLKNTRIILIRLKKNRGKGAALKTGVEMAWNKGADAVIFIDADGQHNPKYLKKFVKELESNNIVFGYRMLSRKMPFFRRLGNIVAVNLIRVLFNIRKKDLLSGYLGFKKEVYEQIKWTSDRYGIETEIATKIGKCKMRFCEFKIDTIYIDKYKGVTLFDAIKVLAQIPRWYFSK